MSNTDFTLPVRAGEKPQTGPSMPHLQLSDNSNDETYLALADWLFSLEHVEERPTRVSIPSTRAAWIVESYEGVPPGLNREFTHIHTKPGPGSQHISLPKEAASEAVAKGWGEYHPIDDQIPDFDLIMVFAPRDIQDLETVKLITMQGYKFVLGQSSGSSN